MGSTTFLVACSGGVDSMVLAHLCHKAGLNFALAHCNFQLRGEESEADAQLVVDTAAAWGTPLHQITFDTKAVMRERKLSLQEAARELRYQWFAELCATHGYSGVAVAHHADDDLETFLINLSRGSGLVGLSGITALGPIVWRPMLTFHRETILAYAQEEGILWREDRSNADTKYLRNKIRHQIVPHLKELHPTFLENFKSTLGYLDQAAQLLDQYAAKLKKEFFVWEGDTAHISIGALQHLQPIQGYLHLLFKDYGFTQWDDLERLLTGMSGKQLHSPTHQILKDREELILKPNVPVDAEIHEIPLGTGGINKPLVLHLKTVSKMGEKASNVLYADNEKLKYPLLLRKWKNGDYFYPFGMQGRKKLSKFFKDEKVDVFAKEEQWLLCSGDKVVWIIGKRADDRFKVGPNTKDIIKITWER